MDDPLVEALRRLVNREGGRHAVAARIRVNEQSLYQILRGIPLPSGRPRGVGAALRAKLTEAYPDWMAGNTPSSPIAPPLTQALPAVLDAIRSCPADRRDELRTLLSLLVDTDAPAYRQRLAELLGAAAQKLPSGLAETSDFAGPAPNTSVTGMNHDPDCHPRTWKRETSR